MALCVACCRSTQGGHPRCCRACQGGGNTKHGPRCQERFDQEFGGVSGDVFVSAKITKSTQRLLDRVSPAPFKVKASAPMYNRKEQRVQNGQEFDVPAFGLKVAQAIVGFCSQADFQEIAQRCRCEVPQFSLNVVVQTKFRERQAFLFDALEYYKPSRMDWDRYKNHQLALQKLKDFAYELGELKPGTIKNLSDWRNFVRRFVDHGDWEEMLHHTVVLQIFGFEDKVAECINGGGEADAPEGTPGHPDTKGEQKKALEWLSKAVSCYNLPGSLADVVNLVYAMRGSPAPPPAKGKPNKKTQEEVLQELDFLRNDIESGTELWIPSVFIHDANMDDMICWLLLEYVCAKRKRRQPVVYMQLPQQAHEGDRQELEEVEKKYRDLCKLIYRDPQYHPDAAHQIAIYQRAAKISYAGAAPAPAPAPTPDAARRVLHGYQKHLLNVAFVEKVFKEGHTKLPRTSRVVLNERPDSDSLLQMVSAGAKIQDRRMVSDAFVPDDEKTGWKQDALLKEELMKVLGNSRHNVTEHFVLGSGKKLEHVRIVLAWHGCNANVIDSVLEHGFAAFSSLDPGYFGAGNYVTLEPEYACGYARGTYADPEAKKRNKKDGEYGVILVACVLGFTYPITPACDNPGGKKPHCKFYGTPLDAKFTSRLAAVSEGGEFHCENPNPNPNPDPSSKQYHEIVCRADDQLLPLAVVYFKD